MKRKSSGTVSILLLVVVVVCGGLAAGYYLTGAHTQVGYTVNALSGPTTGPAVETPPNNAPVLPRQLAPAGHYTAPGAPDIEIAEIKTPTPITSSQPDYEQSQTGASPTATAPDDQLPPNAPIAVPIAPSSTATDSSSAGSSPSPVVTQPTSSDATPNSSVPAASPAAAPTVPAIVVPSTSTGNNAIGSLYKVEAGTFTTEKNARGFVGKLKSIGFSAQVEPTDSSSSAFRVQVGAFRSKAAADDAVTSLQSQGYPAYITSK